MGSKFLVVPQLADVFSRLDFETVLDAFSGSGVVSYALKAMGKEVTANDFLRYPATLAKAAVANSGQQITAEDLRILDLPNEDGRAFIADTFAGRYFPIEDHEFFDSTWSHMHRFTTAKQAMIVSAMCLAAARKQPRGVFTITQLYKYDDGRRSLRSPMRTLFLEAITQYNAIIFSNGRRNKSWCHDIFALPNYDFDLVYLDPPYVPPHDDNDYIKRYHFLEGLSCYWKDCEIMYNTNSRKIAKRFTPFGYKRTIENALYQTFDKFRDSTIVLSYSSNSLPDRESITRLLRSVKRKVSIVEVPHRYSFGTHAAAQRREVTEYIFVAK